MLIKMATQQSWGRWSGKVVKAFSEPGGVASFF